MFEDYCSIQEFIARLRDRSKQDGSNAQGNSDTLSEREEIDLSNSQAESLARDMGLYIPYMNVMSMGVPAPSGVENDVYFDNRTNTMIKVNNLMTSKTVLRLFQRLLIHNSLFPQTRYELIGFTGLGKGSIFPILRQDYVPNATYATHGEILDYMEALGFSQNGEASFTNGTLDVLDMRPRNVLRIESGDLFVVDADFRIK